MTYSIAPKSGHRFSDKVMDEMDLSEWKIRVFGCGQYSNHAKGGLPAPWY
jgi:hypothetical protein